MSVQCYLYSHNGEDGVLLIGQDDEPYRFQTQDGNSQPLSLDDVIHLDTAEAAFLAEADALVGAWRNRPRPRTRSRTRRPKPFRKERS